MSHDVILANVPGNLLFTALDMLSSSCHVPNVYRSIPLPPNCPRQQLHSPCLLTSLVHRQSRRKKRTRAPLALATGELNGIKGEVKQEHFIPADGGLSPKSDEDEEEPAYAEYDGYNYECDCDAYDCPYVGYHDPGYLTVVRPLRKA